MQMLLFPLSTRLCEASPGRKLYPHLTAGTVRTRYRSHRDSIRKEATADAPVVTHGGVYPGGTNRLDTQACARFLSYPGILLESRSGERGVIRVNPVTKDQKQAMSNRKQTAVRSQVSMQAQDW
jgi:hypothetical protein